jgi:type III secretion protein Q
MNTPLVARRVSRDALAYRNLLSHSRAPARLDWLGGAWRWSLVPRGSSRPGLAGIEVDWGGARVVLLADRAWMEQVVQDVVGSEVVSATPALVMQAMLEVALGDASTAVEKATRKRVRVVGSYTEPPALDGLEGFGWRMEANHLTTFGEVWVDSLGLGFLAAALRSLALSPDGALDFSAIPVPVRFCAGWVDLTRRALADIALRDVIALDECWLSEPDRLTVRVGSSSALRCELTATTLEVTEGWTRIMEDSLESEHLDDEQTADEEGAALDDIPVRLTFDLGERVMPLAELKTIAPGYTFDLGRDLRRAVTIRANGLAIGEGELVDIDGRIGVSILTLKARAQ